MSRERPVVSIDLSRVRENVARIARESGVGVIAVVKADAYGLGARRVAAAVARVVEGFYTFNLGEAIDAGLTEIGRPVIALRGDEGSAADFLAAGVRPAVWSVERAKVLRSARPVLVVDTGQQRFACPPEKIGQVIAAGAIEEAFTHASTLAQATEFAALTAPYKLHRHAAGSALLDEPSARFDAVRPGLAMYDGTVTVTARLIEARDSRGPAGYTGFKVRRFGVILAGYANGLRPGPAAIGGRLTRVLEVGMQTAFIELGVGDDIGDEVTLLGGPVTLEMTASAWGCSQQNVLVHLCATGERKYSD